MKMIMRAHGGGGSAMSELLDAHVFSKLVDPRLLAAGDAAVWKEELREGDRLAMTTDAFVVNPLFFPGGDIGRLAVCGTVNDLAMSGARPKALSLALILEEGFPLSDLDRIMDSAAAAAREAGVSIVTGDTKVVERGHGNGCFAVTAGVGVVPAGRDLSVEKIEVGDAIVVSASIANHGAAVMCGRNGIAAEEVHSDAAPLAGLVERLLDAVPRTRFLRDATRGGIANLLCEAAVKTKKGIELDELRLPITPATRAALSILGLDPLGVANEGVFVAVVPRVETDAALAALRAEPLGVDAAAIGTVTSANPGDVIMTTAIGGRRVIMRPFGEELPRIC